MGMDVHVVIFTAGYRLCRDPEGHLGPLALWPVGRSSALARLLDSLAAEGIRTASIYSDRLHPVDTDGLDVPPGLELHVVIDPDISGTAGMLRLAVQSPPSGTIVVLPANVIRPPLVTELVRLHRQSGAELTLFMEPRPTPDVPEIYVCEPSVVDHIPPQGYWDIKERLIPELVVLDRPVRQAILPEVVRCFHDADGYLDAVLADLGSIAAADRLSAGEGGHAAVWTGSDVRIDQTARIHGPVVILDRASIGAGSVVVGPALIGQGAQVGERAVVCGSVVWPEARVGSGACISASLVPQAAQVNPGEVIDEQVPAARRAEMAWPGTPAVAAGWLRPGRAVVLAVCAAAAALFWSFWPQWVDLWGHWQASDEYSAGMLVPGLALYVIWCRRSTLKDIAIQPCMWGMVLLVASQALRLYGLHQMRSFVERSSVVVAIMGLVLWLGGLQLFRRLLMVMVFLVLMLPWPQRVHGMIALPLQGWSTASAVFGLEILGYPVVRQGNVIQIGQTSVAVAEACSGLRMVTAFIVISALLALLVDRTWWEKAVMVASSLPIALACNTTRLIVTAIAFTLITGPKWEKVFHDFGGYAMMPLAVAILLVELRVLRLLTTAPTDRRRPDIIVRSPRKDSV